MNHRATRIERQNRRLYSHPEVVEVYADSFRKQGLLPPEEFILDLLAEELAGCVLLDLGVGGGRTTARLAPLAGRYVGVDYSPEMIRRCRAHHPGLELHCCDAGDMAMFREGEFDAVFFPLNGIDHADLEGRLRMLGEIRRVLRPGGWFVFSTHHLDGPRWRPSLWPGGVSLVRHVRRIFNYLRNKRLERHGHGWAMRVDQAHDFGLLMYHCTRRHQLDQLDQLGFRDTRIVSRKPEILSPEEPNSDGWLYYVARKA